MRKGQIEIIGLLIVVVLIVIGALFYVKFALLTPDDDFQKLHSDSIDSNNLINAILNVKVCENTIKIKDGIVACANNEVICDQDACGLVEEGINTIFETIGDKKRSFVVLEGEKVFLELGECEYGVASGKYPIRGDYSSYDVQLRVCE
jgi:flagellin-like protein